MKKVILFIAALVMVFSGVAAVSAYEAHIINVTATVENAISVTGGEGDHWALGTIFPQEYFSTHYTVGLSGSFLDQKWDGDPYVVGNEGRVNAVEIEFWAEEKETATADVYYAWMGEFVLLGTGITDDMTSGATKGDAPTSGSDTYINLADTGWTVVGPMPGVTADPHPRVKSVLTGRVLGLQTDGYTQDDTMELWIAVDACVFLPFYNYETDVYPKPNGLDVPTYKMPATDDRNNAGAGDDFGLDIKIQVVDIYQETYVD